MTTIEVWTPIKNYEGLYEVSNLGRIKSLGKFNRNGTSYEKFIAREKIRSQSESKFGYMNVVLCKKGKSKTYRVHRLVAEAFIPNCDNKPHVNHKDYNRKNNCAYNLEWVTSKENCNYSLCHQPKIRRTRRDCKSGERYINYHKGHKKYVVNFKGERFGEYKTIEDAIKVRDKVLANYEKYSSN